MTFVEFGDGGGNQRYRWGRMFSPGWHDAEVVEAVEATTKSGTPMIELTLGLTPGGAEGGVRVMDRLVLSEKAWWRVEAALAALAPDILAEIEALRVAGATGAEVDFGALVGRQARAQVETEMYDGKDRPKIKSYARGAAPAAPAASAAATESADDIPF